MRTTPAHLSRSRPIPTRTGTRQRHWRIQLKTYQITLASLLILLLCSACGTSLRPKSGIGKVVPWSEVPGWEGDDHSQAWPALQSNCKALAGRPAWQPICKAMAQLEEPQGSEARLFFETWFEVHELTGTDGSSQGLITGYYEPLLHGSLQADERYAFPLYARPDSLLRFDLAELAPSLADNTLRGRLEGRVVKPFYSRAIIESGAAPLTGAEVMWVDNAADAFFLHVQGSGRVLLEDGRILGLGFADHNGYPYVSIGKVLVQQGELALEDVSLFSIRQWLRDNPARAQALFNENPRYIFFVLKADSDAGAVGSLNVPLTPGRSIAIDPTVVPLGTPVWLSTRHPGPDGKVLQNLVFAQDTGAAIKGPLRADLFWGHGKEAEVAAGTMKEQGSMLVLLPAMLN
jgi:membrane-bound lytic murein transglycosylase A